LKEAISKHPLYRVWDNMKSRCYNSKVIGYNHCGRKGIIVCDEWKNSSSAFISWALANGYKQGLVLNRKDKQGNYEPANCNFISKEESWSRRKRY